MSTTEPKPRWDGPPLDAWRPWTPREVASVLEGFAAPWRVVGGWAIDLALGRETRAHEDLEIAIDRERFPLIHAWLAARGLVLHEAGDNEVRRLAAGEAPDARKYQNWVEDPAARVWLLDVMLEPSAPGTWIFRRDRRIRAPYDFMVAAGPVPHLKLHGVLLYKAKNGRPKDEADFANAAPMLAPDERAWLAAALEVAHPDHPWIACLAPAAPEPHRP